MLYIICAVLLLEEEERREREEEEERREERRDPSNMPVPLAAFVFSSVLKRGRKEGEEEDASWRLPCLPGGENRLRGCSSALYILLARKRGSVYLYLL